MPVTDPLPESNCEQGDVFTGSLDSLQVPKGNQSPVFVELCAGSAKLSDAVKQFGYNKNRHSPRCKLVQLDLSHTCVGHAGFLIGNVFSSWRAYGTPLRDLFKGPRHTTCRRFSRTSAFAFHRVPLGTPHTESARSTTSFSGQSNLLILRSIRSKTPTGWYPLDNRKSNKFSHVGP